MRSDNEDIQSATCAVPPFSATLEAPLNLSEAQIFYAESLRELAKFGVPFLLAGTYAVCTYTGIKRDTKDLDIFCKAGDYPRILSHFKTLGYKTEIEDERWIGKLYNDNQFIDVIFNSFNGTMPVNDEWFNHARQIEIFGTLVKVIPPTELIWSKAFIQSRQRYDGADIAHVILKQSEQIDWHRLLGYMEQYWEVLLMHLLNFRWIYPTERDRVPRWLMDELMDRLKHQLEMPRPQMKICRGRMFSHIDYEIDVKQWGFADIGSEGEWQHDG
jgi:predicted nucleotidyltransferase